MSAVLLALALLHVGTPGVFRYDACRQNIPARVLAAGPSQDQKRPELKTYHAAGPGHSIKAVGDGGRTLTLEDGSVWSIDPRTQYKVSSWQNAALITVVLTNEAPDFNYVLNNEDVDDWTFAILLNEK